MTDASSKIDVRRLKVGDSLTRALLRLERTMNLLCH